MAEWDDWIGCEERRRDVLTQGLIDRFCATVLRRRPEPSSAVSGLRRSPEHNATAPPGLHWCLCLPDAPMEELGPDGHPKKGGFMPPIPLPRRMFAASDIAFLAPLEAGAAIERVSTIASIAEKGGKSGQLVFVEVDHVTLADSIETIRERQTIVYREAAAVPLPLPATGTADLSRWPAMRTITPSEMQLFRYSALTFNAHRIHYDAPYARDEEGYPALVVHGPLIASLLMQLAADEKGGMLERFAFRAKSPAFTGQPLHLC
ncbi:MAG: hypothetical protein HKN78_02850, partial [Sphingomonadaceae bacterium]|nr:hypothetical protein [Sphingomonadaceae bacterium]